MCLCVNSALRYELNLLHKVPYRRTRVVISIVEHKSKKFVLTLSNPSDSHLELMEWYKRESERVSLSS